MTHPQRSRTSLLLATLFRVAAGILLFAALLFLPAGTTHYWQAWLYLVVLFTPMILALILFYLRAPALLERRMRSREPQPGQVPIVLVASALIIAAYLVPGFDRRYGWSNVPDWLALLAAALVVLSYAFLLYTLWTNRFAARVVDVEEGQRAITTGPYAVVRHPMYLAITLLFLFTPLALGSYWGMLAGLLLPVVLVARIDGEETLLRKELEGYEAYCQKVRYRMLPFLW